MQPSIFNNFGVLGNLSAETVFEISSQTINNCGKNSKQKFSKFYDEWDHISKPLYSLDGLLISFLIINMFKKIIPFIPVTCMCPRLVIL